MKLHSDILTLADLHREVPAGCYLEAVEKGSRSRARAFDVRMSAEHGHDSHGLKRIYRANSGTDGAGYERAATYIEWGDWMVALLKIDPRAVIGSYDGADGFVEQTTRFAPHRPARENAVAHARRWRLELAAVAV